MRRFRVVLTALLLCGCAGTHKQGSSVLDSVDGVQIDQMTGNAVSGQVFERTVLCLNARRETRFVTAITNQTTFMETNVSLSYVTNQTITISSNAMQTLATNKVEAVVAASGDTNAPTTDGSASAISLASPGSTNTAVTTGGNFTVSRTSSQTVTTTSAQLQRSRQATTNDSNMSVTVADQLSYSAETNDIVAVLTNVIVATVTNTVIELTNMAVHDYFLTVEFTPPPDFILLPGESLVLLVDGARHALAPAAPQTAVVPRKGFSTLLYRVPPQLLVDIANAREVRIRLKGAGQMIDKQMNAASRQNFKKFLVKYFTPEDAKSRFLSPATPEVAKAEAQPDHENLRITAADLTGISPQ